MVIILAVDTRTVPKVAMVLPVTTTVVARYKISLQVKVRQLVNSIQRIYESPNGKMGRSKCANGKIEVRSLLLLCAVCIAAI